MTQERIQVLCGGCVRPANGPNGEPSEPVILEVVASPSDGQRHDGLLTTEQRRRAQSDIVHHIALHISGQFRHEEDFDPTLVSVRRFS